MPTKRSCARRSTASAREPSYRPIVLIENATRAQVIAFGARKLELPGIDRPAGADAPLSAEDMAAHLFGYVGEVSEAQLARPDYQGIEPGAIVGQAGVEQAYNQLLMGDDGAREVVVNSLGREIEESMKRPTERRAAACS